MRRRQRNPNQVASRQEKNDGNKDDGGPSGWAKLAITCYLPVVVSVYQGGLRAIPVPSQRDGLSPLDMVVRSYDERAMPVIKAS